MTIAAVHDRVEGNFVMVVNRSVSTKLKLNHSTVKLLIIIIIIHSTL